MFFISSIHRQPITFARSWSLGFLEDFWETFSTPHGVVLGGIFHHVIVMSRSWSDAFGEDGNSLKIIPPNTNTFAFVGRFLEVWYLIVFIRRRVIQLRTDIDFFAKAHGSGSFVHNSRQVVDLMTRYKKSYLWCEGLMVIRSALGKANWALEEEVLSGDLKIEAEEDSFVLIFFYGTDAKEFILS